jgi:hypothetical protein
MNKALKRRPSPAMVVAMLALFVAIGGTALAGGVLNKKKVNKIISNRAPGLSVASAKNADRAKNADNADRLGGLDPSVYRTSSNFTSSTTDVPITGTLTTIGSPIQVTTEGTKRLIALGSAHATNNSTTSTHGTFFFCHVTIDGTAGVDNTDFASPNATWNPVDASVAPMASAVVGPGTHTVALVCAAVADPVATVKDDSLAAWAVSG